MNYAETVLNVLDSLTTIRAVHGGPSEISIADDAGNEAAFRNGWSKSALRNGQQVAFLVVAQTPDAEAIISKAQTVQYGRIPFVVSGTIQPPKESGGFWLLPVREK